MKRSNVKSRIKKDELNPLFHFKEKAEDDKVLTQNVMKQALKSGKLELSSKNLKFGKCLMNFYRRLPFEVLYRSCGSVQFKVIIVSNWPMLCWLL